MVHDPDDTIGTPSPDAGNDNIPELELSDEDIFEAMEEIPGYLDVSSEDFRVLYHLAHRHAVERVFKGVRAAGLMRTDPESLHPDMTLDAAAAVIARQGLRGLPVVDADRKVVGMLTETDFLRWLQADTFMELLLRLAGDPDTFSRRAHECSVRTIMTPDVVVLREGDGFLAIVAAFHAHEGGAMPVVDDAGRLSGMLTRDAFLKAFHLEGLL